MTTNLLTQLKDDFRGDATNSVASALGETPATTQMAVGAVLAALIGGLVNRASTTDQADNLLDLIKRNKFDTGAFGDVSSALTAPSGINGLIDAGRPVLSSIFDGRSAAVTDWVASHSGVSRSSSSSLLSLALPIVLGMIARRVASMGWNGSNLMRLLGDQRAFLQDAPAGLAGILSAEETPVARRVETHETEGARRAVAYETAPRKRSAWVWALPLLFLIPLLGYFLARDREPRREAAVQTTPAPRTTVPRAMPEPARPVGTTGATPALPMSYQLHFDTGSPMLTAASSEELRTIVETLRAHPQAKAEIAGYTDNAGNDAYNMKLSQERATATMNRIASLGIDRSRLTAEGYGESHPVSDNATAEGRQLNRRVEIRITG